MLRVLHLNSSAELSLWLTTPFSCITTGNLTTHIDHYHNTVTYITAHSNTELKQLATQKAALQQLKHHAQPTLTTATYGHTL